MIGIYKIENIINNKVYIGQSTNIAQRWRAHKSYAKNENNNYPLYRAIRKYGIENFKFSILQICPKEQLNELEIYWIKHYNACINGYNQTIGGEGNSHPLKLSENQVLEIYEKLKGSETMETIANEYNVTHATISNINNGIIWVHDNMDYPIRKKKIIQRYCCDCGIKITKNAIRCRKCNDIFQKKEKPVTRNELKKLIRSVPFSQIAKTFNVSDNAIKKWCDFYNLPRRKIDIKKFSDEEWENI